MENQLDNLRLKIDKLIHERNSLLLRICGVSDELLSIQLRNDYKILEESINNNENKYLHVQFSLMAQEHIDFYTKQFTIENNIIKAIELTNPLVYQTDELLCKVQKIKLRIPNKLSERRLFTILANSINKRIKILDMESKVLDEIGNYTAGNFANNNLHVNLHVNLLSRWQDYENIDLDKLNTLVIKDKI